MRIRRDAFKRHIEKILCGKLITEAVFTEGFATQALSPDHLLLVVAPSLEGVEPLDDAVGLGDLPLVLNSLTIAPGEGNEVTDVDVEVEDDRLVIHEGDRAHNYLLTSHPKTIGTRVEDSTVKKLLAKVSSGKGFHLTRALIEGVQRAFTMYKATELELFVGKDPKVRVGSDKSNYSDFPFKELKGKDSYSVLLDDHFVKALGQITDFDEARLRLGGPDAGVVCVEDGEYQYILSPKSRAADEKKKAKQPKGAKGKGEEPEPTSEEEAD